MASNSINHWWAGVKTIDEQIKKESFQDSTLRTYASILPLVGTVTFIFNLVRASTLSKYHVKDFTAVSGKFYEDECNQARESILNKYLGLHAVSCIYNIMLLTSAVAIGVFTLNPLVISTIALSLAAYGLGHKHIKTVLPPHYYNSYPSSIRKVSSLLPVIGLATFFYNAWTAKGEVQKILKDGKAGYKKQIDAIHRRTIAYLSTSSTLTCVLLVCAVAKGFFVVAPAYYGTLGAISLASMLYGIKTRLIITNHSPYLD